MARTARRAGQGRGTTWLRLCADASRLPGVQLGTSYATPALHVRKKLLARSRGGTAQGTSEGSVSPGPLPVVETPRLVLHRLTTDDADFILQLLNEPSFLRFIGDKGVRTREDACRYISDGPIASYGRFGFGLYRVGRKDGGEPIGMCGLLKRDTLEDVDVGFAFLPRFWSNGFALESTAAVVAHGRQTWGLKRILAITSPDNEASIRLLAKLGFRFERMARLSEGAPEVKVFAASA